jgi:DUF4097 and DUF4098 domain-containing protein YvlB
MSLKATIKSFALVGLCAGITSYGPNARSQVSVTPAEQRVERGAKVIVRARTGHIKITGSDGTTIQATAVSDRRSEPVQVRIHEESPRSGVWIVTPDERAGGDLTFDVKLPRYAEVKLASLARGEIEVTGIDGAVVAETGSGDVSISKVGSAKATTGSGDIRVSEISGSVSVLTHSGDIQAARLGSLEAQTRSGDVIINSITGVAEVTSGNGDISAKDVKGNLSAKTLNGDVQATNIGGLVSVASTSGTLTIDKAGGDVRANAVAGDITVTCVKGQVDAGTASGTVTIESVDGNVEAKTASGVVVLRTAIRANGRYNLQALSGEVTLMIAGDPPGFTVTLSTYNGSIETDFPLEVDGSVRPGRRITGRYRDGQARISLDTFSGLVKLGRLTDQQTKKCN